MAKDFEAILRMMADYHNFCSDNHQENAKKNEDELSLEELDLVAAAAAAPIPELDEKR